MSGPHAAAVATPSSRTVALVTPFPAACTATPIWVADFRESVEHTVVTTSDRRKLLDDCLYNLMDTASREVRGNHDSSHETCGLVLFVLPGFAIGLHS